MNATAVNEVIRPACQPPEGCSHRRPLSRDEEVALSALAAAGDRAARDRMIEANLGLVHTVARDFAGRGLEMDDVVGEGRLGLFRAVEKFDPRHGVRFGTYAAYWIREAIRTALIDKSRPIRVPAWVVKLMVRWRRTERRLREASGRAPTFGEVADELGLSDSHRTSVFAALRLCVENQDADGLRLDERIAAAGATAEDVVEAADQQELAFSRLSRLHGREREVVSLRYGLGGEVSTLEEVGRRIGLTRQRAGQIEREALSKLRGGPVRVPSGSSGR